MGQLAPRPGSGPANRHLHLLSFEGTWTELNDLFAEHVDRAIDSVGEQVEWYRSIINHTISPLRPLPVSLGTGGLAPLHRIPIIMCG
jgi:hypothetical protein